MIALCFTNHLAHLILDVKKAVTVFSVFHKQIDVRPEEPFELDCFVAPVQSFVLRYRSSIFEKQDGGIFAYVVPLANFGEFATVDVGDLDLPVGAVTQPCPRIL